MDVVQKICDAFPKYPIPDFCGVDGGDDVEAQQVAFFFSGRRWDEVTLETIRQYDSFADASACLAFMPPDAFVYYFPSFMKIIIENYRESGSILDSTISSISPLKEGKDSFMQEYHRNRISRFNNDQKDAIISFLIFLIESSLDDDYFGSSVQRALSYWEHMK